jgi:hypothetical protein
MSRLGLRRVLLAIAVLFNLAVVPLLHADDKEDFDTYKVRIDAVWYYINPSGDFRGTTETGSIDIQKDLGFKSYSTLLAKRIGSSLEETTSISRSARSTPLHTRQS